MITPIATATATAAPTPPRRLQIGGSPFAPGRWGALALAVALGVASLQNFPAVAATPSPSPSTNAAPAPRYEFREIHSRDGIGKFYLGREISHVMGHPAADWLERPEREEEEHTTRMLELLKVRPGMALADVGCGTGYITRKLARLTGPSGRVHAVDIQPEMLTLLTNTLSREGITNVIPVLGTVRDPGLPPNSIDLALLVDVYHELEFPHEMTTAMVRALKPGGQLVLVEFRGEDPNVPIKPLHKMTEAQVRKEMAGHPLEWVGNRTGLPWQHVLVFRKKS